MAALTIRNIDPRIKERLRVQAARHGRSMEEEARTILHTAVTEPSAPVRLGSTIAACFARFGGVELELPPREPMRRPPKLR